MSAPTLNRRRATGAVLGSLMAYAGMARAQEFPSKSLRIVLPLAPGSSTDAIFRTLGEQLALRLKQPVIIENRPGADGLLAVQAVASAPADGHTLMMIGLQAMVFAPLLRTDLPYKAADFTPVSGVARGWTAVVVGPNSRFTTFEDYLAAARKQREAVTMGSYSLSYHVGTNLLGRRLGAQFKVVPYKTFPQVFNDLAGGVLDAALVDAGAALQLAASGKLRVLAVASKERLPQLPQVMTFRERGIDFEFSLWTALAVRTGTPEAAVSRIERELQAALASSEMRAAVAKAGSVDLSPGTAQAVAAEISADNARFRDIAKEIST